MAARRYTQQEMEDQLLAKYQRAGQVLRYSPSAGTQEIDNPAWEALDESDKIAAQFDPNMPQPKIKVPTVAWRGQDVLITAYRDPQTGEFQILDEKMDAPTASEVGGTASARGPNQRAMDEEEAAEIRRERKWNLDNGPRTTDPLTGEPGRGSGLSESHAERAKRERDQGTESRAVQDQEWQRQQIDRQIANEKRQADQQAEANRLAQAKFDRDKAIQDRPDVLGTPTDSARKIAVWDPTTNQMKSVDNPMYDAAKAQAAQLKDQLSTGIALNQITAQQAAQQYKEWWDVNVELPFKQSAEVRARAAEQREALAAEDRRKQFASDFSLRGADLGFRAGQAASENEIALLPYRAGPTAAAEFSSAFNSLAKGGKINGPDASAGINFTPGAFEFDRPDFDKIAAKATKNALKGITKYKPEGQFSQGDYSGISMPTGEGAPTGGGGIDLSELWKQYAAGANVPAYSGPSD